METEQTIDKPAKLRAMIAFYDLDKGAFAASLGIHRTYLSKVLSGDESPSLALLERACDEFTKLAGKPISIGDIWG